MFVENLTIIIIVKEVGIEIFTILNLGGLCSSIKKIENVQLICDDISQL